MQFYNANSVRPKDILRQPFFTKKADIDAMDEEIIEEAIIKSLKEASEKDIEGKAVTPFLLERISQLTDGESLKTNVALVCNNALLGAKIASAYAGEL